jgi:hypothetical protein
MQKQENDVGRDPRVKHDHDGERGKSPAPERRTGQPYTAEVEDYSHPRSPGQPSENFNRLEDINPRRPAGCGNE